MQSHSPELNHSIIRAGAGAGKTTGLVERVVEVFRLFQAQGERPRIVVTTFTRKATQELKERLIKYACKTADAGLLQFVTDPSRMQISTIHGLLNIFLRQVGHLAGLDAGFQLITEEEGRHLAKLALRETVAENPDGLLWLETYGFNRTLMMLKAFEQAKREHGELQVATMDKLEGATAVLTEKWKARLGELSASILEEVDDAKWVEFAGALAQFVKAWSGDCTNLDSLPSKPRNSKKQEHLQGWHERAEVLKDFKDEMGKACFDKALWPQMIASWQNFETFALDFSAKLNFLKESQARFEMADLELKSMEILRQKPFLGSIFAENWDYWMIDEYQDTSPLQVACLKALIGERPKYYVGDPQQSIYLFRGAEVRVFNRAQEDVRALGGQVKELRRNYRSEPDLLYWINDFMASMSPAFQAMEPREALGRVDRSCVIMHRAADEEAELEAVVAHVGRLLAGGASLEQICILGRTHRTLMDVSRALRERGFPTHVHSSRGFNERREVMDAQALWKFLINPHDNLNLLVLLRTPWFYVADALIAQWMEDRPSSLWQKLQSVTDCESLERLKRAQGLLNKNGLSRTFEETLCEAGVIDLSLVNDPAGRKESNIWKLILRAKEVEKEGGQSVLDFVQSSGGDMLESSEGDATSAQEPNSINLMTIHGSKGLEFDHVIIPRMGETPNTSKTAPLAVDEGLFFFPSWQDALGEFVPSPLDYLKMRKERERELEEFDRWLYVAVTRAKSTLTMTWSKSGRESWAERSSWFKLEPKIYERDSYRFEVLDEPASASPYLAADKAEAEVRMPFKHGEAVHTERLSVSELVLEKPKSIPREDLLKRWQAQNQGTRIHHALEALKYGEPTDPTDPALQFVMNMQSPPMLELIADGEAEWGFQVKTPVQIVEGQIDLWGKHDGTLYVVDYKSGSRKFLESAFSQLSLYAWALRKFGHQEPIELLVIYPIDEKIERRKFSEELFAGWETKFSSPKA